jgi:outer membrane protein OmpA-like peptidoglycan-associated protein/ABC-type nitrate/sulfonate/bicarbonate transport system substrate-binding protein
MSKLTPLSKTLLVLIIGGAAATAYYTRRNGLPSLGGGSAAPPGATAAAPPVRQGGKLIAALSEWPGHMALVIGNGGLRTRPGSAAAAEGLDLQIVFIEDAIKKNQALQQGTVDFVWQTVDELPISMGSYRAAGAEARAFVQIDWSRGGDACISSAEVQTVEDIKDRKSAMMLFSPDHTVFEFMITNSRLTREELIQVRKNTAFSPDDFTFGRRLFAEKKVDVACLWEPDVTLALESRPGAHRLFSTADASELVADVLLARRELLDKRPEMAAKVARVWFAGVKQAMDDKAAAARFISSEVPRFRDELGYDKTLAALDWVKWTDLSDNVRFFGLDGQPPAFDRVYNQADSIWISYPQAEIKDRFAPVTLRDDRVMRGIWEAAGRQVAGRQERYQAALAASGDPLFTKPVTINFHSAAAALDAESMAIINHQLLPQLEIARNMYVRVEGNTDSVGPEPFNRALSEKRARAIVDYLVSRGIDKERMSARGNGSTRPVASNKTAEGRARNRRTDILFIPAARASR